MLNIYDLPTPTVLVDLDRLNSNIERVSANARRKNKILWPMFKTTKSSYIAKLQADAGATGFLCSSIYEAEKLIEHQISNTIMLAYPTVDSLELNKIAKFLKDGVRVIVRLDDVNVAKTIDKFLDKFDLKIEYCIKVNVGYSRYGVNPSDVGDFVKKLTQFRNLKFIGLVTHQGNAYGANRPEEVKEIALEASKNMKFALELVRKEGFEPEIIGAGSTPTLNFDIEDSLYTHLFPGNYVYYDRMQALLYRSATLNDCALSILVTINSIPDHAKNKFAMINAGSRYFDKRTHRKLKGYGQAIEHPKAIVLSVSQEVSKMDISKEKEIRVGEKIRVIPNHSCFTNDFASMLVGCRNNEVKAIIRIDAKTELQLENQILNVVQHY